MDPISWFFVSYAELVQDITKTRLLDIMGTDVTSISVTHEGVEIPYSFQLWRIQENTVCSKYKQNAGQYSKCTVSASSLFQNVCTGLQQQKSSDTKQRRMKNMYCNAAINYQPTIANVQWTEERSEEDVARRECNTATAIALGSTDPNEIEKREAACNNYREIRSKNTK